MNKKTALIAIFIVLIDQITKIIVSLNNIDYTIIPSHFKIMFYKNTGAAWSILEGRTFFLIISSIIALGVIFNIMLTIKNNKFNNICFGLLIGGIIGNLIDRIFYGYVRDFIDVAIVNYNFPVFNIADATIIIGIIMLIITTIKGEEVNGTKKSRNRKKN